MITLSAREPKPSRFPYTDLLRTDLFRAVCLAFLVWVLAVDDTAAGEDLTFVTVNQGQTARDADMKLERLMEARLKARLDYLNYDYEEAIRTLADWDSRSKEGEYLARLTPYVYITAELLGADLEILGTYHSQATDQKTYHSYFVVHRDHVSGEGGKEPELRHLLEFLRDGQKRRRFVYHSRFSTSSYFLPSLYLRSHRIFHMDESSDRMTAIRSDPVAGGSTDLVRSVARGEADFAAVWDGTKSKFDLGGSEEELGRQVHFIQLPDLLPNDLLVCSASLPDDMKKEIRAALADGGSETGLAIGIGDFRSWVDINAAPDAREALVDLRWRAREAPAPVTVRIAAAVDKDTEEKYLEAARQAVRLSGTELVVYDDSFHRRVDYEWRLRLVREGYLEVESEIPEADLTQTFHVSFRPDSEEDLAVRLDRIVHSRLHRVRYLWPYDQQRPLVIRDVMFSLPRMSSVTVQEITWLDPQRNEYSTGSAYEVRIKESDYYKFTVFDEDVLKLARGHASAFDPMSNAAYRVVLVRPEEPRGMFRVFNSVFYGLVAISVVGSAISLRRKEE